MAEFNSRINIETQGIEGFVRGLNEIENEIRVIEGELRKVGLPEAQIRRQAQTFRRELQNVERMRVRASEQAQQQIRRQVQATSDVRQERLGVLRDVSVEAVGVFTGTGLGEVFGTIVDRISETVDRFSAVNSNAKIASSAFTSIGNSIENITLGFLAIVGPLLFAVDEILKATGLAATQFNAVSQSIQEANVALQASIASSNSLQTLDASLSLREENLNAIREEQEALLVTSDEFNRQIQLVEEYNQSFERRLELYKTIQEANSDLLLTDADSITNQEELNDAFDDGQAILRRRLVIARITRDLEEARLAVAIRLQTIANGQRTLTREQLAFLDLELQREQDIVASAEEALLIAENNNRILSETAESEERITRAVNTRNVTELEALRAEQSLSETIADEQQQGFDTALGAGNFAEADSFAQALETTLGDLNDTIQSLQEEIIDTGDVSREAFLQAEGVANSTQAIYTNQVNAVNSIGDAFNSLVTSGSVTAFEQQLRNIGNVDINATAIIDQFQEELESFGADDLLDRAGFDAVGLVGSPLGDFLERVGLAESTINSLSTNSILALNRLYSVLSESSNETQVAGAELDFLQTQLDNQDAARREAQANRERELITLRQQREAIDGQIANNQIARTDAELIRIRALTDAAESANASIFKLLLQLNRVNVGDAMDDFTLRRSNALNELSETALEAIEGINQVLQLEGATAIGFELDPGTGAALITGLTQELRDNNPILAAQLDTIVQQYNLVLDTFVQEASNLPLIIADRIAKAVRIINRFELRELNLDIRLNEARLNTTLEDLNDIIQEALSDNSADFNILNTSAQNDAIREQAMESIEIENASHALRIQQLRAFHDDGIESARRAGQDTTLLERERELALQNSAKQHQNIIVGINEQTNDAILENNRLSTQSIVDLSTQAIELGVSIGDEVNGLLDVITQGTIDRIQRQIDFINETISDTTSNINSLESDLANSRSGRRDALLRGIELEQEREEGLNARRIQLQRELAEEERRQSERRKGAAIAQALINGALAITNVWANNTIPYPAALAYNVPQTAALAGITGVQVAAISNQTFADGGLLQGKSHAQGGIPFTVAGVPGFEAEGGEAIINKRSTAMFRPLLSAMNEAGGGTKFQSGGLTPANFNNITEALSGGQRRQIQALSMQNLFVNVTDISNLQGSQVRATDISTI